MLLFGKLAYILSGWSPVCKSLTLVFLRKDYWPESSRFVDFFLLWLHSSTHYFFHIDIALRNYILYHVDHRYLKHLILGVVDVQTNFWSLARYIIIEIKYPKKSNLPLLGKIFESRVSQLSDSIISIEVH